MINRDEMKEDIFERAYESWRYERRLNSLFDGILESQGDTFYIADGKDRELKNIHEALDEICRDAYEKAKAEWEWDEYVESGDYEKDLKAYEKTIYD